MYLFRTIEVPDLGGHQVIARLPLVHLRLRSSFKRLAAADRQGMTCACACGFQCWSCRCKGMLSVHHLASDGNRRRRGGFRIDDPSVPGLLDAEAIAAEDKAATTPKV